MIIQENSANKQAVAAFFKEVFDQQYYAVFQQEKNEESEVTRTFVLKEGDQILAAAKTSQRYQALKISDLAVATGQQDKGLGSQLLTEIKAFAKEQQMLTISLTTRSYQAKGFYQKQGFDTIGKASNMPFAGVDTYYMVYYV